MNDNKDSIPLHPHGVAPAVSTDGILKHLWVSIVATITLAVIVCGIYPLVVWGLSQALFHDKANGSLITNKDGTVVASRLIGQSFSDAKYFHPRPSAAGNGYDPTSSGGSNLGPMSAKLINGTTKPTTLPATKPGGDPLPGPDAVDYDGIQLRIVLYCQDNNIPLEPADMLKTFQDKDGNYDQVKLVKAFNDGDHPLTVKATKPIPADAVTSSASGLDPHISPENAEIQAARVAKARGISDSDMQKLIGDNTDHRDLGFLGEPGVNLITLNLALDKDHPVAPPATKP